MGLAAALEGGLDLKKKKIGCDWEGKRWREKECSRPFNKTLSIKYISQKGPFHVS